MSEQYKPNLVDSPLLRELMDSNEYHKSLEEKLEGARTMTEELQSLRTQLAALQPTWTDTPPDREGWWWMGHPMELDCATLVEVFKRPGHDTLVISSPDTCQHTKRNFLMVAKLGRDVKWSSHPIPMPKEA